MTFDGERSTRSAWAPEAICARMPARYRGIASLILFRYRGIASAMIAPRTISDAARSRRLGPEDDELLLDELELELLVDEIEAREPRQRDDEDQHDLDHEAAHAVDHPDRERSAGLDALTLEEPDLECHPRGRARHGELDELDRVLQHQDGSEQQVADRRAHRGERLWYLGERRQEQGGHEPRHVRGLQLVPEALDADVRERGDQAVGEERDQRHDRDRLAGDASELLELRRLGAGHGGGARHQLVEVPVPIAHGAPGVTVQHRRLQVRQYAGERLVPHRGGPCGDRSVGTDDERGRHQDLREIRHHRPVGGGDAGATEVADRRRPVCPYDDPVPVELSVRDPELMELRRCSPDPLHNAIVDVVRVEGTERPSRDLVDQQRVALVRHPGSHDREDRHARSLGEQGDERLMLHLLQAAEPEARTLASPPHRRPDRGRGTGRPTRPGRRP